MVDQVSLDTTSPEDNKISLDTGVTTATPSASVASTTAKKAELGLSSITGKSYGEIYSNILNGYEGTFRQEAASAVDLQKSKQRQADIIQATGKPGLANILSQQQKPTDPNSVIEQHYAAAYTAPLNDDANAWTNKSTVMREADPQDRKLATTAATDFTQRRELALSWQQKALDAYQGQSWLGWGADQLKMMTPGNLYLESKLRDNVPVASGFKGLGDALELERQGYAQMPFDQYSQKFSDTMQKLINDNPSAALMFAHSIAGQTVDEENLNNQLSYLGLTEVGQIAAGLTRTAWAKGAMTKAVKDVVKSSINVDQDGIKLTPEAVENEVKVNQASGLGDQATAAVQKTKYNIFQELNNKDDPIQKLTQPLNTLMKLDGKRWVEDPGNAGQEIANRIGNRFDQTDTNLTNMLQNMWRVNRMPILQEAEDVAKMAQENIKHKYPGPSSAVMDVSDPLWEPMSNTYHFKIAIGNHDAEMFSDPLQAEEFARHYGVLLNEPAKYLGKELDNRMTEVNFKLAEVNMKLKTYGPLNFPEFKTPIAKMQKDLLKEQDEIQSQIDDYRDKFGTPQNTMLGKMNRSVGEYGSYSEFRKSARATGLKQKDLDQAGVGNSIDFEKAKARKPADEADKIIPAVTSGAEVKQHGLGWYIEQTIPNDETQSAMVDNAIKLWPEAYSGPRRYGTKLRKGPLIPDLPLAENNPSLMAATKAFGYEGYSFNLIRNPGETLSPQDIGNRVVATHGPNLVMNMLEENDKFIKKAAMARVMGEDGIYHSNGEDFLRVLQANQTMINRDTGQPTGWFFRTGGELDTFYKQFIGRHATEAEHEGYAAYLRNYEIDRSIRFLGKARNMWRVGAQMYSVGTKGKYSEPFPAVKLDKLPRLAHSAFLSIDGAEGVRDLSRLGTKEKEKLDEKIKNGEATVLQMYEPDDESLHSFSKAINRDNRIVYAVVDNIKQNNIRPEDLVPYNPGGHHVYNYRHKISRADIHYDPTTDKYIYKGDTLFSVEKHGAVADKVAKHLSKVQEKLHSGLDDEARLTLNYRYGLDMDNDIIRHFNPTEGADGVARKARFSRDINEPFRSLPMGKTIIDMDNTLAARYGDKFVDGTKHGSLAKSSQIEFTGERDAYDIYTHDLKGKLGNPVYEYRPADLMDPIESLNRGASRITNSGPFMDDYKYNAVFHWLANFMRHIEDGDKPDRVYSNMFTYFNKDDPFKKGTDKTVVSLGLSTRKQIQDFLGTPSKLMDEIDQYGEKLYKSMYGTTGRYTPVHDMHKIENPASAVKNIATHVILGLGNIHSFWTQFMGMLNVHLMRPLEAPAVTMAHTFYQWLRVMPNHIDYLDKLASSFDVPHSYSPGLGFTTYKPGWFKEAAQSLMTGTGFFKVSAEHSWLPYSTKYIPSFWNQVSNVGLKPFGEAAQMVRATAWFAAHLDWRKNNPTAPWTREAQNYVIAQAADYDHNMSRAFNSSVLNKGVLSMGNTFFSYGERIGELVWGKRRDWFEKMGLTAGTALTYGLPGAAFGSMIFPIGDWGMKQVSQGFIQTPFGQIPIPFGEEGGYSPQRNAGWDIAMQGYPSYLGAVLSGGGDYQKGTEYNFNKWGVGKGYEMLGSLLDTDKSLYDALGGAPMSVMAQTWKNSTGFRAAMWGILSGKGLDNNPITWDDLNEIAKTVSTWSSADQYIYALRTGKLLSRAGNLLGTVGPGDATFRALFGLTDVRVAAVNTLFDIGKDRESFKAKAIAYYRQEMRRADLYLQQGDDDNYKLHYRLANHLLDLYEPSVTDRSAIANQTARESANIVDQAHWNILHKGVPDWQVPGMQKREGEEEKIREKQGK